MNNSELLFLWFHLMPKLFALTGHSICELEKSCEPSCFESLDCIQTCSNSFDIDYEISCTQTIFIPLK